MNKKALVFAVAAACLTSGAAFAQSYGYNDGNVRTERSEHWDRDGRYDSNDRQYNTNDRYGRDDHNRRDYRDNRYSRDDRYSRRDHNGYRVHNGYRDHDGYRDNRYIAQQRFQHRQGGYLAHEYRDHRYVVSDWRGRRLHQPQRGYHWVQAGNDYLLVAIATGLISQVFLNH